MTPFENSKTEIFPAKMLAVSFAFPPLAYPRSIQVSRLLKHINVPTFLVTADEQDARKDPTMQLESDFSLVHCLRIPFSISRERRFVNRVTHHLHRPLWNWLNITPDQYGRWKLPALNAIQEYARRTSYRPEVIVTFSHPYVDHSVGLELKNQFRVPWITHFSDPWADNLSLDTDRNTIDRNLELERSVVQSADRVIFTSQETADLVMSKYPDEWKRKARVLPHCFDSSLFSNQTNTNQFKISVRHIGSFYGIRTPQALFKGIRALLAYDATLLEDVVFELIGPSDTEIIRSAEFGRLPEGLVKVRPPVDYQESLSLMTSADGLLIIDAPAKISVFLPSKLIDYIGSGRPILGFTPEGTSANLIRDLGGWVVNPQDDPPVQVLKDFLSFLRKEKKHDTPWGNPDVRRRYEAKQIARSFEAILREVL